LSLNIYREKNIFDKLDTDSVLQVKLKTKHFACFRNLD